MVNGAQCDECAVFRTGDSLRCLFAWLGRFAAFAMYLGSLFPAGLLPSLLGLDTFVQMHKLMFLMGFLAGNTQHASNSSALSREDKKCHYGSSIL
jgi:hypothetical protein